MSRTKSKPSHDESLRGRRLGLRLHKNGWLHNGKPESKARLRHAEHLPYRNACAARSRASIANSHAGWRLVAALHYRIKQLNTARQGEK